MEFASKYCFVKEEESKDQINKEQVVDTNIFSLSFKNMKISNQKLSTGDPIFCEKCSGILNYKSKVYTAQQYKNFLEQRVECLLKDVKNKSQKQDQKTIDLKDINQDQTVWVCEFCRNHNLILNLEKDEIPEQSINYFLLEDNNQLQNQSQNSTTLFILDNSGSMSSSTKFSGNIAQANQKIVQKCHEKLDQEFENMKPFLELQEQQQYQQQINQQKQQAPFVSRKLCLQTAVESQIQEIMAKNQNNSKQKQQENIGLILFNNEITILGNGQIEEPLVITGDRLNKYDEIVEKSQNFAKNSKFFEKNDVNVDFQNLIDKMDNFKESGQTALGPAILAGISFLQIGQNQAQKRIILCSDGLANTGLGNLEMNDQQQQDFYKDIALIAQKEGIIINQLVIKGTGCKLQDLECLSSQTNGSVKRADPQDLVKDVGNFMNDEMVCQDLKIQFGMNRYVQFKNIQEKNNFFQDVNELKFENNVTLDTTVSFEFEVIDYEQIKNDGIGQIPFQGRFQYINQIGQKILMVCTVYLDMNGNLKACENQSNPQVIQTHIAQKNAYYYGINQPEKAQQYNSLWSDYLDDVLNDQKQQRFQELNVQKHQQYNYYIDQNLNKYTYMAKCAEIIEDYKGMIEFVKLRIQEIEEKFTQDEISLISVAFKNLIGEKRTQIRALNLQKYENDKMAQNVKQMIQDEMISVCQDGINVINQVIEQKIQEDDNEQKLYLLKMKADYYRYMSEIKEEYKDLSEQLYQESFEFAKKKLRPTNPILLGLCLNYSVFYYELMNQPQKGCQIAKEAFDNALEDIEHIGEDFYKDSTAIMQLLRDNLTLWTSELDDDQEQKDDKNAVLCQFNKGFKFQK